MGLLQGGWRGWHGFIFSWLHGFLSLSLHLRSWSSDSQFVELSEVDLGCWIFSGGSGDSERAAFITLMPVRRLLCSHVSRLRGPFSLFWNTLGWSCRCLERKSKANEILFWVTADASFPLICRSLIELQNQTNPSVLTEPSTPFCAGVYLDFVRFSHFWIWAFSNTAIFKTAAGAKRFSQNICTSFF